MYYLNPEKLKCRVVFFFGGGGGGGGGIVTWWTKSSISVSKLLQFSSDQ